jgi:hypothetical protein
MAAEAKAFREMPDATYADLQNSRVTLAEAISTSDTWTVIGLWYDGTPLAAGAIRGDHPVDGDLDYRAYQPWATTATGETADEAMENAVAVMAASLYDSE